MKITLFTSNKNRHNYLINLLSDVCDELFVVQECSTIFTGLVPDRYPATELMKMYFEKVNNAQLNQFGNCYINTKKKINFMPLAYGDLNKCSLTMLSDFLQSHLYIIFGGSYIKGPLADFLVNSKAINIHMGVSPYYRGTDCNFWALYDNNPHLVGSTIHMLSKGLDDGPILYHALSKIKTSPFDYTMSCVKAAFHSLKEKIENNLIFQIEPQTQKRSDEIRYSKRKEFDENIIKTFFEKNIDLNSKPFDRSLLKDPFFFDN